MKILNYIQLAQKNQYSYAENKNYILTINKILSLNI